MHILKQKTISVSEYILMNYHQVGLSSEEFIVFLHFSNGEQNLQVIAQSMGKNDQELLKIMQHLLQKQLLTMEQIILPDGKIDIQYSFDPFYQKLVTLSIQAEKSKNVVTTDKQSVIETFEQEFGRSLTPMEITTIYDWIDIDNYSVDLIIAALKEAVLAQVTSLQYIRRILENWHRKNIKTIQEAEAESEKFRQNSKESVQVVEDVTIFSDDTSQWFK